MQGLRIAEYLEECYSSIQWADCSLVGFTCSFEQIFASLCLAKLIKTRHPHLTIVFGGSGCYGEMGLELLKHYSVIDCVCTGEGDIAILELADLMKNQEKLLSYKGFASFDRSKHMLLYGGPSFNVENLDDLPIPDYSDYFAQLKTLALEGLTQPVLVMESSRGCWWGQKHHCSFCGLNADLHGYRCKSKKRIQNELIKIVTRYKVPRVVFSDNILPMTSCNGLFPSELSHPTFELFAEVKSNLREDQLASLSRSGVTDVQPGIESLSTVVLALMNKGVTGIQNIAFLKWARALGVKCHWNLLYGFPNEPEEEYRVQLEYLKRITHLDKPRSINRIRLDKFSPLYRDHDSSGLTNVRPLATYGFLHNCSEESLGKLASVFDFDYVDGRRPETYIEPLRVFCEEWAAEPDSGTVIHSSLDDGSGIIVDTRFNRKIGRRTLDRYENQIYAFCRRPQKIQTVVAQYSGQPSSMTVDQIGALLDNLWEDYFVIKEGGSYLALAISR